MFTWICPQCGREVPPSYTECPDCTGKAASQGASATTPQPPPAGGPPYQQQPVYQQPAYQQAGYQQVAASPPPPQFQAQQAQAAQHAFAPHAQQTHYFAPQPTRGLPTWLMAVLFALAFVGLGSGIYWLVGRGHGSTPAAQVENPAAKPGVSTNPLQRYVEVSAIRFVEDKRKKLQAKFVITNHSDAEITGLAGNVTIWGSTKRSEEDALGTFAFNTNLSGNESKELTVPLTTKLKPYELPDWQNVTTDLQITAPTPLNSGGSQ